MNKIIVQLSSCPFKLRGTRSMSTSNLTSTKRNRVPKHFNRRRSVHLHKVMTIIDNLRAGHSIELSGVHTNDLGSLRRSSKSSTAITLISAAAAILVSFSSLEEGERLRDISSSHSARAAFDFRDAVGVLADEFALGLGAGRLVALPVAAGFLADGLAFGFRGLAVGDAVGLLANSHAFRAVEKFAAFIRAFNLYKIFHE